MDYYVFIDESGSFGKESDKSVVGAGITTFAYKEIETSFKNMEDKINSSISGNFDINKDIHIAPLLHADEKKCLSGSDEQREKFSNISKKERVLFANACLKTVNSIFEQCVFSKNTGFDFGKIDPQERYGLNLIACISESLNYLKNKSNTKNINIYIAPRSKKCLPSNFSYNQYHSKMIAYLKECFKDSLPKEISLSMNYGKGKNKALGFDCADVICYYRKKDNEIKEKSIFTKPNQLNFEQSENAQINILDELIEKKEFDTAYRWADSKNEKIKILDTIKNSDDKTKASACSAILNIGYVLIDKRTTQKNALKDAIELFQNIVSITKNNKDEKVKECFLSAANGLLVSSNHCGDKDVQEKVYKIYQHSMEDLSHIPYFTRQENILAVRNRAYNNHFNDYRFQDIVDDFEDILKLRISQLPENEMDGLTGEMCGTIGQAYAFNSKNNKEFAKLAENYFKQSLEHFPVGHKYHAMSVNYLTTLMWYQGDLQTAKSAFAKHPDINENKTASQLITNIINAQKDPYASVFNISVLLRLAVAQGNVSNKGIDAIESFLEKCDINDHPYELIYKWLGIAYLKNNDYDNAIKQFDKSIELSNKLGFTVQTLSISVMGLKCIALQQQGSTNLMPAIEQLQAVTKELSDKSANFANYIETIGGIEQMLENIQNNKIDAIAKWLPFSYA